MLNHMIVLFLFWGGTSILLSTVYHFLKDRFTRYRILCWYFFFQHSKYVIPLSHSFNGFDERSADNPTEDPLYVRSPFCFAAFSTLSAVCDLSRHESLFFLLGVC